MHSWRSFVGIFLANHGFFPINNRCSFSALSILTIRVDKKGQAKNFKEIIFWKAIFRKFWTNMITFQKIDYISEIGLLAVYDF